MKDLELGMAESSAEGPAPDLMVCLDDHWLLVQTKHVLHFMLIWLNVKGQLVGIM